LTTLGACGDVNRNVMACPAPLCDGLRPQLQADADAVAAHLAPRSRAYHEVWLDGERAEEAGNDPEPIYGKGYLPPKVKVGFGRRGEKGGGAGGRDVGFLGLVEGGRLAGYNVLVGGSMGMTHGNARTFPQLGKPVTRIDPGEAVALAEAVVKLFRDHGN